MSTVTLALGIIMFLGVRISQYTIDGFCIGFLFAAICLISLIVSLRDKRRPYLATASIVVNIVGMVLNLFVSISFTYFHDTLYWFYYGIMKG